MNLLNLKGRSRVKWGVTEYEPLIDHLLDTSKKAEKFCSEFGAILWGKISGLFHDAGKCSDIFQEKLKPMGSKVSFDHPAWGAKYLYKKVSGYAGKALAFIICGHHGGLANSLTGQSKNQVNESLHERLNKDIIIGENYKKEFDKINVKGLKLPKNPFSRFIFIKMIFSCLVDADRLDSEEYNSPEKAALRKYDPLKLLLKKMKCKLQEFASKSNPTEIDKIRSSVQKTCINRAWSWWNPGTWYKGLFSLTVPTGGGKTLASIMFALIHAIHHHQKRIIYVLPYTTIIEQNAEVFRNILGENNVIEHQCHFEGSVIKDQENKKRHYLSAENWDGPVIVTTNVQFFESLFSSGATRSRKIHNIVNSFIVLDEAHLLPSHLLKACIKVINELVSSYGCSVLFCTATQPGFYKENGFKWGVEKVKEIVSDPCALYKKLERVNYQFRNKIVHDNQMAHLARSFYKVLCVVNTKRHARVLYEDIKGYGNNTFHLSTLMCVAHRRKILENIKRALKNEQVCRVVSTQLIECGVDIDFPVVIRNISGASSIIQSGGRCNREGLLDKGQLIITNLTHQKRQIEDDFMNSACIIAERYLRQGKNLLNNEVAQQSFIELYRNMEDKLDKPIGINTQPLLNLINNCRMDIPFEEISKIFKIIESSTESIIIPYDTKARDLINELRQEPDNFRISRELQAYTVQSYTNDLDKIAYAIDRTSLDPYKILVDMSLYDNNVGLKIYNSTDLKRV